MNRLRADEARLTQTLFIRLSQPNLATLAELAESLGKSREETAIELLARALKARRRPAAKRGGEHG